MFSKLLRTSFFVFTLVSLVCTSPFSSAFGLFDGEGDPGQCGGSTAPQR